MWAPRQCREGTHLRVGEGGRSCTRIKPVLCRYCTYCSRNVELSSQSHGSSRAPGLGSSPDSQLVVGSRPPPPDSLERWRRCGEGKTSEPLLDLDETLPLFRSTLWGRNHLSLSGCRGLRGSVLPGGWVEEQGSGTVVDQARRLFQGLQLPSLRRNIKGHLRSPKYSLPWDDGTCQENTKGEFWKEAGSCFFLSREG